MRNIFLSVFVLVFSIQLTNAQNRPNIIMIMTDDQGWFDVGFNGNKAIKTPNLDQLANQGIIFDRFYSASAVCSPTRASFITGRNPFRMNIPTANSGSMLEEEITIAELVKQKGYSTGHFGKWHLGILTRKEQDANRGGKEAYFNEFSIPSTHGYDNFFCTESKVPTYDPMICPAVFNKNESKGFGWTAVSEKQEVNNYNTRYWTGHEKQEKDNLSGDDTRIIMDRVIPFINKAVKLQKPFFTTVWTHTPHLPVVASKYYKDLYKGASTRQQLYYGCITALDDQIGRLWNELEKLGIADNTMIWFCSDNGPENGTPGSAGYYRERKRSLHEGGLRIPAFVVWKNELIGGRRINFPAFTSDYLPTLINMLDIKYPDNRPLDGIDILPLIKKPNQKRKKPMGFRFKDQVSWVNHQYKLISKDEGESYELYDLLNDEKEEKDIINDNIELASRLKNELNDWLNSVDASSKGKDY